MSLIEKIQKIEALIDGAKTDGERQAATLAKQRVLEKIARESASQPREYTITTRSRWNKKLLVALCAKHQLRTYRYSKQRYTTVVVRVNKPYMEDVLWPEFQKYSKILEDLTDEIMEDLISKIHRTEEEEVIMSGELLGSSQAVAL